MTPPIFTRYLYEKHQVAYSLQWALMERNVSSSSVGNNREEALYWAYELYHSGFEDETWHWVRELYVKYYEDHNPRFKDYLDGLYLRWKETGDACLLGTAVGTLAIRDSREVGGYGNERFIILYKEDRHQTKPVTGKSRDYLKHVSRYPIRPQAKYMAQEFRGVRLTQVREAYLGLNWLYYCAESPIWRQRIQDGRGKVAEGISIGDSGVISPENIELTDSEIVFETDDDLEAFYEKWGFEPDEQPLEMHHWHGIYPAENENRLY